MSGPAHFVPNPCFSTWTEHNAAVIPIPVPSFGMETKINMKGPDLAGLRRSGAQGHIRGRSSTFPRIVLSLIGSWTPESDVISWTKVQVLKVLLLFP